MGGGTRNILKGETSFMVYFASLVLGGNRFRTAANSADAIFIILPKLK